MLSSGPDNRTRRNSSQGDGYIKREEYLAIGHSNHPSIPVIQKKKDHKIYGTL
jgi:hypothetical protein